MFLKKIKAMKIIHIFFMVSFFLVFPAMANPGSSKTEEIDVNGLKVIIKYSKNEVVTSKIFFKGGTANYGKEQEGIEQLALESVVSGGTTKLAKDAFNAKAESEGLRLNATAGMDYGTISMNVVKRNWNDGWEMFADMICNPAFPEDDFNNIKEQLKSAAAEAESDPDSHLRNMAMINVFGTGSYASLPQGSPKSLEALTIAQVKDYYKMIRRSSSAFLVIVGDVKKEDVQRKVAAMAACFPNIPVKPKPPVADVNITTPKLNMESRDIATNYVRGIMNAPDRGSADEVPMQIAMSIMRDRMFEEVRTKRNLSYAPSAGFPSAALSNPYTILYVSTDSPSVAVKVMADEVRKVIQKGFSEKELTHAKSGFITEYYMGQETNDTQAEEIGKAELTGGYARLENLMANVNNLSLEELNKVFRKYCKAIDWTYLGDTKMVDEKVFKEPIVLKTIKTSPINTNKYPSTKVKNKKIKDKK